MLSPSYWSVLDNEEVESFGNIYSELNMDLFSNVTDFDDMGWLSGDGANNDFDFYPHKPFDNGVEMNSLQLSGSPLRKSSSIKSNKNESPFVCSTQDGGQPKRNKVVSREKTLQRRLPEGMRRFRLDSVQSDFKRDDGNQSSDDDESLSPGSSISRESKQGLSKNAIAARENRMKKKRYIDGLEKSVKSLGAENCAFRKRIDNLEEIVEKFQDEVAYLRNVLANVDEVAELVESIRGVNRVKTNGSYHFVNQHDYSKVPEAVNSKKRKVDSDDDNNDSGKRQKIVEKQMSTLGGVCIHVNKSQMSLEFCPSCSVSANQTWAAKAARSTT